MSSSLRERNKYRRNLVKKYFLNPSSWQLLHTVGQDMDACSRRQRCQMFSRGLLSLTNISLTNQGNSSRHKHCQPTTNTSGSGSGQYRIETQQTKYSVLLFTSSLPPSLPPYLPLSSDSCDKLYQGTSRCFYTLDESL